MFISILQKTRINAFQYHLKAYKERVSKQGSQGPANAPLGYQNNNGTLHLVPSDWANAQGPLRDNVDRGMPVYIPLFQAVFGMIWKSGLWSDELFTGKMVNPSKVALYFGLAHKLPYLFNRGGPNINTVDMPLQNTFEGSSYIPPSKDPFIVGGWSHFGMLSACSYQVCRNCGLCIHDRKKGIFLYGNMMWWFCSPECIADVTMEGGRLHYSPNTLAFFINVYVPSSTLIGCLFYRAYREEVLDKGTLQGHAQVQSCQEAA
jgi:hypothetical protein